MIKKVMLDIIMYMRSKDIILPPVFHIRNAKPNFKLNTRSYGNVRKKNHTTVFDDYKTIDFSLNM